MEGKEEFGGVVARYSINVTDLHEENKILRETIDQMKGEIDRFKKPPLMVCEVADFVGGKAIIRVPNGTNFFVEISTNCDPLRVGDTVLVEQKNLTVLKKIPTTKNFNADRYIIVESPKVGWNEIGGLEQQIREMQEVIELPLKKPKLFERVGIQPPKGVLLYGEPGTGKTLLAKAVATSTKSTFIEIVGSELVQKFIGEGAKLVKEIFQIAKEKAPSIIFIDELDALAAKRVDLGTSGEREVQRTFMQLLAEIDGFKHLGMVKVIGCTNRRDILDPAILRPGRLDRLIRVPLPNKEGIATIMKIHSRKMSLDNVDVGMMVGCMEGFSGAEIRAACTEAGYFAIRENRSIVSQKDFLDAIEKIKNAREDEVEDYLGMFG
jgi:proteasome regulatory subunit